MKFILSALVVFASTASAGFDILHQNPGGSQIQQCEALQVNDAVYYNSQNCQVQLYEDGIYLPSPASPPQYHLNLGACGNSITKVILDNKMYKVDYDISLFKALTGLEPEVYISNYNGTKLKNCHSPSGIPSPPEYPLLLILEQDFDIYVLERLIYATDQYNRPVVIMDSVNGDIECDGYTKEVDLIDDNDLIFANSF